MISWKTLYPPLIGRKTAGQRNGRNRLIAAAALVCLLLVGCQGKKTEYGAASSRVAYVSRDYVPPNNGQTITPPQRMADVTTLWKPLSRAERTRAAAHGEKLPLRLRSEPSALAEWLPPSEQDVMREYLYRLSVTHPGVTRRSLERAQNYLPGITAALRSKGLPESLAALPLVESAFEPRAVSSAGAVGLWQLMPATARRYGLTVSKELDERFDPVRSTEAAAGYLDFLYRTFGDWPLALAAYNCGEGAMLRALQTRNASSLAGITHSCRMDAQARPLTEETLRFVPQFVAAVTVMQQSGDLGLAPHNLISGSRIQGGPPISRGNGRDAEDNRPPSSDGTTPDPKRGGTGKVRASAAAVPGTPLPSSRPEVAPGAGASAPLKQNAVPAMRPAPPPMTSEGKTAAGPRRTAIAAQPAVRSSHAAATAGGAGPAPMKRLSE